MFGSVRDPEFWGGVVIILIVALLAGVIGGYVGGALAGL
jgi:hypothetical protein